MTPAHAGCNSSDRKQQQRFASTARLGAPGRTVQAADAQPTPGMDKLMRAIGRMFGLPHDGSTSQDPENRPPRSCNVPFDGLPPPLTRRRSSGPAAPQLDHHLPEELLGHIARKLSEGPHPGAGLALAHVSAASKTLRAAVADDAHARRCLMQAPLVHKALQIARTFLAEVHHAEEALQCVPIVGLMDPQQQARLVQEVLEPVNYRQGERHWPHRVLMDLVPNQAHLDKPLRAELVAWATRHVALLGGLGRALAHFDEPSRDIVVTRALSLPDADSRARAIRSLGEGLASMSMRQRQRVWDAAMSLQEGRQQAMAITGLGAGLKYLPSSQPDQPDKRDLLFEHAINLNNPWDRVTALGGLAASIDALETGHKEILLTHALDSAGEAGRTLRSELAVGVMHLEPTQRSQLADAILHTGSYREKAKLGSNLAHLAPEYQDRLLTTIASLDSFHKVIAIAGLAKDLDRDPDLLAPTRRSQVVALLLGMDPGRPMAKAIHALCRHLPQLKEDLRDTLVGKTCELLHDHAMDPEAVLTLTEGVGAGMGALRSDQRDALIAAVAAMSPHKPPYRYDFMKLPHIAAAIAGLASGQQHLDEPQFQALIDTATRLDTHIQQALDQDAGRSAELTKTMAKARATAFFGLARGASASRSPA